MTTDGASREPLGAVLPAAIIVMGVSGSGKSTVGAALAAALGWDFRDGDAFHPPANVEKMRAGAPLTDTDRWPWLDAIGRHAADRDAAGDHVVIACSALRRIYRDRLRASGAAMRFVHLDGSFGLIDARMAARRDHFMPPSLLESQFATLEPPEPDEAVIVVPVEAAPGTIVTAILGRLRASA
ncbi:gluconokinase [Phreatobacter sp. AB_2022a]|uniref:gluconokinase n=1 Tax=Phreatobacter sp. AB_2022a TaxID=3003134 RepID=UPI00228754CB|nr:gluconokinase [Phreatobacter sp. AB_2022a]MCZ0736013.1 gluconokinase [Phreatobacter sp. AB_2022a]